MSEGGRTRTRPSSGGGGPARPALEHVTVLANERLAEGVGLLTLRAPRTAGGVRPGQFVHVRLAAGTERVLRRPFSVHDVDGTAIGILFQVLGEGTREMAGWERGFATDLLGPLGHGFEVPDDASRALLVAGGLGAAPLGLLSRRLAERGVAVTVALGAPTAERLVSRDVFERSARRVAYATDDGSHGERGPVTALVEGLISADEPDAVCACGPEAMARVVAAQAAAAGVPCLVSLERLMACGVGACLSCMVSTRTGLKRACADGPVFDAEEVLWDESEVPPRH
ncbi:MAG: dihydroorotate dehydrogenase electron transfer subunit [Coriobacteriia bacterium]|nr:dihydroorotate dehydrogenase electron transfer subunit [Coriobacteriia bacterium]